jgi:hypothetical protein
MNTPVIVVGRPRSGSTLFARILNESQDLFVLNDLYYLQQVDALEGFTSDEPHVVKNLAKELLITIEDRLQPDSLGIAGIESKEFISKQDQEKLETFTAQTLSESEHNWSSILATMMKYSANLFNKKIWGYNTPQDYLHLPRLQQAFPDAKFIFLMRDPRDVLLSYKHSGYLEGYFDSSRYHPILQALAWKSAMKCFWENQKQDNILLVKYEDLVRDTNQVLANVGNFVGTNFPLINLKDFGNNSSFKKKNKKELTNTEIWLCEQIAGQEMKEVGYSLSECQPCLKDVNDILDSTKKAVSFYLKKSFTSADIRKRVLKLVTAIW